MMKQELEDHRVGAESHPIVPIHLLETDQRL